MRLYRTLWKPPLSPVLCGVCFPSECSSAWRVGSSSLGSTYAVGSFSTKGSRRKLRRWNALWEGISLSPRLVWDRTFRIPACTRSRTGCLFLCLWVRVVVGCLCQWCPFVDFLVRRRTLRSLRFDFCFRFLTNRQWKPDQRRDSPQPQLQTLQVGIAQFWNCVFVCFWVKKWCFC